MAMDLSLNREEEITPPTNWHVKRIVCKQCGRHETRGTAAQYCARCARKRKMAQEKAWLVLAVTRDPDFYKKQVASKQKWRAARRAAAGPLRCKLCDEAVERACGRGPSNAICKTCARLGRNYLSHIAYSKQRAARPKTYDCNGCGKPVEAKQGRAAWTARCDDCHARADRERGMRRRNSGAAAA